MTLCVAIAGQQRDRVANGGLARGHGDLPDEGPDEGLGFRAVARPQVVAYVARKGRNGLRVVQRRALSRGVSQASRPRWSSEWPYDMAQDWPASCILIVDILTQEERKT